MSANEITWTKEDVQLVEKFIEIKRKGFYVDGGQLTAAYNRILHKSVGVTQCGSCLRQRVSELEDALNRFKRLSEEQTKVEETPEETPEPKKENKKPKAKK